MSKKIKVLSFIIIANLALCSCNLRYSNKGSAVRTIAKSTVPFDSRIWKIDKNSRYAMSYNWDKYKNIVGLSLKEVVDQLGPPDHHETSRGYYILIYDLMDSKYPFFKSKLKIYFKNEKLVATEVQDLP